MAELANIDVKTMDYSYMGEPYVWYSLDPTINFYTMDYSYMGEPLVINSAAVVAYNIKSVNTVGWSSIKKLFGIAKAGIKKIMGVEAQ